QWADSASLRLLRLFLTDPMHQHLLVLGAYRENEVDGAHPLVQLLRALDEAEVRVTRLSLAPFALQEVTQFVADTVQAAQEIALPLAEIVFAKTQGNPFFVGEFLKALYQEGLLFFSPPLHRDEVGEWRWEVSEIKARDITDNVVDFMRGALEQLPERTQETLKVAAALGNAFDLTTLARAQARSLAETAADLWPTLEAGLVLPLGESYRLLQVETAATVEALAETMNVSYRFLHDRVQQAAYALLAEEERPALHLRIGQLLLTHSSEAEQEERLFAMVDHLNTAMSLVTEASEREALARLNLRAGQKAKSSTAYEPAFQYLQHGLSLLPDNPWQSHYDLALALYREAVESAYLQGNFVQMETLAAQPLTHARTVLDKVKIYEVLIQAKSAEAKLLESIALGREILAHLGISTPVKPTKIHALKGLLQTRLVLGRRSVASLAALPKMQNPQMLAAMRLLRFTASSAYYALPALYAPLIFQMVQLSVQHGNAPASPSAYATYGLVLATLGDFDRAYEFGQLTQKLLEQPESREFLAHANVVVSMGIQPLKEPLRDTLPAFQVGYQSGMETGDLPYASVNAAVYGYYLLLVGAPLPFILEEINRYLTSIKRSFKHDIYFHGMMALQQMVSNLLEPSQDPYRLTGAFANEDELFERLSASNDLTTLSMSHMYKTVLGYHFGEYERVLESTKFLEHHQESVRGTAYVPAVFYPYQSLALLALYQSADSQTQKASLKKVAANQKKMKKWALHAPMNYQHLYELVQAEWERVQGNTLTAMQHYQRAISLAREHNFPHNEALANELAARFYLEQGLMQVAQGYMMNARYGYLTWGAQGKVQWLDVRYPTLLPQAASSSIITGSTQYTRASSSTASGSGGQLDLASVIKASQTISGEIDLDRLLDKLLGLLMENAGAQKGVLLLADEGRLLIQAEGVLNPSEVRVLQALPVEESTTLSAAIVHYVARTHEDVVLDNASREGRFANDPYIRRHTPRSIMSAPILNQGKLIGVIYLENNLTTGAFTPDRVEIVQLLGTQAAISITNAQAIAARTEQERTRLEKHLLEQRAQDLAELNASKDKFFSIISHDLRSPFNSLLGLAQLMSKYSETLSQAEVKDFSGRIYNSGKQVLALLDNLLHWSQMQTGRMVFEPEEVKLQELVKRTLSLLQGTAASKGIELSSDVEDYLLYGDPNMLETVLRNLVSNALKFTDSGGRVSISAVRGRGRVEIAVTDTGLGMSRETIQKLFRIDVTHTTAGTAKEQGTGLGLILSKELVEQNGGQIGVESVLGQGSTFKFTVPLASQSS
ncbi:MAG: GAF domain-containing protein, partial [Ardenticatenales bacterium]|nr:GAF domain-containing protein [Ardenticatenales bacterium]